MADYQLTGNDTVVRVIDNAHIPNDPANPDRKEYDAWNAIDGNTPDSYVPPATSIPQSVSRMQAMVALSRAGLLTAVQSWVAAQDSETQLIWNNAPDFSRGSTLLANAATALGMTSDQIDALFVAASAINP